MISLPFIVLAALGTASFVLFVLTWASRSRLRKDLSRLHEQLDQAQGDLQKEQGKAGRLTGFFSRLLHFGISPTGQIPRTEFAEALIDAISALLKVDEVVLFQTDAASLDLLAQAGRGISPDTLSRLRICMGEGLLGRAAQGTDTVIQNNAVLSTGSESESFFTAPYMIVPLLSQTRCSGLLLMARPQEGSFSPEARELAQLFGMHAALTLEDHAQHQELELGTEQAVNALMRALEAKDTYTHQHSGRTRSLVRAIAQEIPLPEPLIQDIEYGAVLHDVGKIGVDDAILKKPGKLTAQEYDVMKKHSAIGQRILQPLSRLKQPAAIVLYHHEWYNGVGYPEGLAGEEIPLGARIVQIIDAWDAMTSDRAYRPAMPKAAAIAELRRQQGTQFDPKLVEIFLRVIDRLEREGTPTTELRAGAPAAAVPT